jgi:hypothetical protein
MILNPGKNNLPYLFNFGAPPNNSFNRSGIQRCLYHQS